MCPTVLDRTDEVRLAKLESLYRENARAVLAYAKSRMSTADAEDVAADVFQKAAAHLRNDPDLEIGRPWLLTVARNAIIDRWRSEQRWKTRIEMLRTDAEHASPFAPSAADRVAQALGSLEADHREVLVLRYVDGLPMRDIARMMGRSLAAVDSLIRRARRSLMLEYGAIEG